LKLFDYYCIFIVMKRKNYLFVVSLLALILLNPSFANAKDLRGLGPSVRAERKELRNELQDKIQNLREDFKQKLGTIKNQAAKIIGGEITAISGTTLTVSKDGKIYTVNTDSNTHFQRHYWGKSSLDEFSVGNKVNIHGKFTDEAKTTILARLVRNLSIMKRHGVFIGDVTAKNSDNFVINSKQRGSQTVFFSGITKFVKRNEQTMTYADLLVGHRVRVKGLWDKTLNKITEVIQVKNYSLPPQAKKTPGPSIVVTPILTSAPTATLTLTLTPTPTP